MVQLALCHHPGSNLHCLLHLRGGIKVLLQTPTSHFCGNPRRHCQSTAPLPVGRLNPDDWTHQALSDDRKRLAFKPWRPVKIEGQLNNLQNRGHRCGKITGALIEPSSPTGRIFGSQIADGRQSRRAKIGGKEPSPLSQLAAGSVTTGKACPPGPVNC